MRLSETSDNATKTIKYSIPKSTPTNRSSVTTPLDVLSNDYADMTLGSGNNSSTNSIRNSGPMLSPKENIKKLKSSFFGCNSIDENSTGYVNCSGSATVGTRKDCSKRNDDAGDYAVMNPSATFPFTSTQTKKSVLVTTNNNPDKVLANTQSKTHNEGFKPIASLADKEVMQGKVVHPLSAFNRQHSAPVNKERKPSADSGYELLELRGSSSAHTVGGNNRVNRPNSVNSEKTSFTPLMRPNSANSERQLSSFSIATTTQNTKECSSLASSSSTLCSSGTITRPQSSSLLSSGSDYSQTSRPSSVVSVIDPHAANIPITSRPSSVSSERELHYASLDLPPCSSSSAATVANNHTNSVNASIQNPNTAAEAPSFTYAQIDFVKTTENINSSASHKKDA